VKVKVFWCRTCGKGNNFGDALGPRLLARVGIEAEWAAGADAQLVTVGSVLSRLSDDWRGTIWGTGFIQDSMRRSLLRARAVSVRGVMSRRHARLPIDTPLGDPGVLAADLLEKRPKRKKYAELIVPHYVDHEMQERHLGAPRADVCGDPQEFLAMLAQAEVVFTSSLHALIAADSLGVPHVWEPSKAVTGGDFKFNDYLSAFGEVIRPNAVRLTARPKMEAKQDEVRAQLEALGDRFGG
jgi:pyruvyltransferase